MRLLRKVWDSPRLLPVLSVMTVLALAGAAFAVFGVLASDSERERDRIASDLASCERGNIGRQTDIDIAHATEDLIDGILTVVFARAADPATAGQIGVELEPLFQEHRAAVAQIQLIDCETVVPGGTPKENP